MEKFNYEPNGYNRQEVNQFISNVINQTEEIIKKYQAQQQKLEKLEKELIYYKKRENEIKTLIIRSEKVADYIKELARKEADLIITDSKNNASRIVNEALLKAEKIENKTELLEKNIKIFKRKLKIIMEQQQAVVEEIDELELSSNE